MARKEELSVRVTEQELNDMITRESVRRLGMTPQEFLKKEKLGRARKVPSHPASDSWMTDAAVVDVRQLINFQSLSREDHQE